MNTPNGPDRDEYLFRLDFAIRKMHSQTWDDEDARTSSLFGLLTARALYTRPGEARNDQRAQLTEALAGPLVDEPGDELTQMTQQAGAFLAEPDRLPRDLAILVRSAAGGRVGPVARQAFDRLAVRSGDEDRPGFTRESPVSAIEEALRRVL